MFRPVNSKVSFPQLEEAILKWWQERNIFGRSIENRRGAQRFTLNEGPPTANGSPGIHHVLSRAFKDVIPRYKAMKGYYTPRIAGWDTHGLPVELEVEKALGFSTKAQIEEYGVDRFNARCRQSVLGYLKEWEALTERIAFWINLEHAYVTMNNDYIETVWWAIKQMWDKGLIYQGYKVTPHCPRCGTSLSSHEVALGYQDNTEDPSVYIKFKAVPESRAALVKMLNLDAKSPLYFVAWTTTPWTLPGNTALAVAADAEYAVVEVDDEYFILADILREAAGLGDRKEVAHVQGKDLIGLHYEPLFEIPIAYGKGDKPAYRIIGGDFVSMDDGTGIVHVAPAYGEIDFDVGQQEGLPLVHTIALDGRMMTEVPTGLTPKARAEMGTGQNSASVTKTLDLPGRGKFAKEADPLVLQDLKERGLLYRSGTIRHTYPFCWRCETPLLYYAKQTWYIKTTAVKESLIKGNDAINWYPEHIKYGRFGDWLQNNVDWAFSRERYWGTPLNVWQCEACGSYECVGSVAELKGKPGLAGFKEPLDLHRPFVDDISFTCAKCGGKMKRRPEVIDCWFDSGAMPIAQYHYPFENENIFEDGRFPADYICEAVDQTRGWFYSLHAIATLLFDRPSFKNVICLGLILDANGDKMSKAKGNVIDPWTVINKYGADAIRWYLFTAAPPGNVRRFSADIVGEVTRRFLLTLWNVYSFFVIYANIDNFTPNTKEASLPSSELDRWITSELNQLIVDVDTALDSYDPTGAGRKLETFVDVLSNWYVRRSRRRFWKSENDADKLSAYNTLYHCLVTLAKLLAPFVPYVAEELYRNLVGSVAAEAPESVHLADFPVADTTRIDQPLMEATRLAMKVSSLGRAARSQAGIKVRQPLAEALVKVISRQERTGLESVRPQVLDELNVKAVKFIDDADALNKSEYSVSEEGNYLVAVPINVSAQLLAEGTAREIVHRLQTMRRSAGFDIADYIVTYYQGDSYIEHVLADFADYIKQETLSRDVIGGEPEAGAFTEKHKLAGHEVLLGVKKLS
ncbi:MAG: isoleucine--tRNA ligase [Chloroflexota bacterium]